MSGGQRRVLGAIPYEDLAIETGSDIPMRIGIESHPPVNHRFNSYVRTVSRFSFAKTYKDAVSRRLFRLSVRVLPFQALYEFRRSSSHSQAQVVTRPNEQ